MIEFLDTAVVLDQRLGLALLAVTVGGIIRGFTGFGSALVIIPTFAVLFGPREAVVVHSIMEVPVVMGLMPTGLRHANRNIAVPMVVALAITTPIGATVLASIDADILKVVISAVILCMVVLLAMQQRVSAFLGRRSAVTAGAFGGLVQGATGVGGPPIVRALMARGDNAPIARANIILVTSAVVAASLISFAAFGLITPEILMLGLVASPVSLTTTFLGMYVFRLTGGRAHRTVTLLVLALTALLTLLTAAIPNP